MEPFGLYRDGRLVAYGELWMELTALARSRYPAIFLRVHPDNVAALRCYAGAGFEPVAAHLAARWNAAQPMEYVWLSLAA